MTESLWDWSRTAASNANSDSAIDWAEGMSPASINNSARAMMAATAKFVYDQSGQVVTGGTSTALTATTTSSFTSLAEGRMLCVEMNATCGDNPTLNVDSRGAKKLYKFTKTGNGSPVQIAAGDMQLGGRYILQYDTSLDTAAGGWIVLNPSLDHLQATWTDIASAATVNIGAAASANLRVTGTTGITAFDSVPSGIRRLLRFAGVVTITHNATSMILPGGANITTAAGDIYEFSSLGSGNWTCTAKIFSLDSIGTTRGSLIYRGASAYQALVPSTVGYVLRDGGVGADPSWVGGMTLLASGTVSAAATLDLTLPSGYKAFRLYLYDYRPATNAATLNWRVSTDNGATYISTSNYAWLYQYNLQSSGGTSSENHGSGSTSSLLGFGTDNSGNSVNNCAIDIFPGSATSNPTFNYQTFQLTGGIGGYMTGCGGYTGGLVRATNIRFLYGTGNIQTMTYAFYGVA